MAHTTSATQQADQLTFSLTTPAHDRRPVFIVGNFNQWQVGAEAYRLQETSPGHYQVSIPLAQLPTTLEYKYVRDGSWDYVELDHNQQERNNRRVDARAGTVTDHVPHWRREALAYQEAFLPKIEVITEDFQIPSIVRTRRVAALLPHDYYETDKHYPVLYLQDGQNLFDDYAPFGNWAVDKRMAYLSERGMGDLIIIAIDHAKDKRIIEFTPSSSSTHWGKGEGKRYVRFLAEDLKKFVDGHFRTKPDWQHTGIGGSSMGGLISIYAGMMYPQVYGKLLIFSPSLWVTPNIPFQLLNLKEPYHGRVYLYGGQQESANMVPNLRRLRRAIEEQDPYSNPVFLLAIDPQGEHNEYRWGLEFPHAIKWLFFPEH
jgi:predicted alpha/beta superfamily hydrolase